MTVNERDWLREDLIRDEGYRRTPYRCTSGKLTIGYGRNIEDVGIDEDEARYLLDRDILRALRDLSTFQWFHGLNGVRQRALINMRFQLGPTRFRGFKKMIAALEKKDYKTAAKEVLASKYGLLDSPTRAARVAAMLDTGEVA